MIRIALVSALAIVGSLPQDPPRPAPPTPPAPGRSAAPEAAPAPEPRSGDVESVDAIVAALYDSISGAAGERRDWDRMRSLFHAKAHLVPLVPARGERPSGALHLTVDDYVQRSGPMLERDGFFESEIARKVETFGNLAHVWSTYEGRRNRDGEPFLRGINSIQLVHERGRWFVLQIAWQAEDPQHPLPARYLPAK